MKNLFKHIIVPYLILWFIQIILALILMMFFDHISDTTTFLNLFFPVAFILANIWLCDKLIGLFSQKRERFDARSPGKQWKITFFRYIWPMISVIIPYLLLLPVYSSGLYWHIQEKYFLWPSFQNATFYLTRNHIFFIIRLFSYLCGIFSVLMFVSVYNYKHKNLLLEKSTLFLLILIFILYINENINSSSVLNYKSGVMIILTAITFLWFVFFKPRKCVPPLKKSNLNFYLFTGLIIFQIAFIYNFNEFVFPLNYYIAFALAVFSFFKSGFISAIIGALCGLNIWSALWWFFCLPDSVLCKCKSCEKQTFSFKTVCPGCGKPLKYETNVLILQMKNKVRPGAIIVFFIFIMYVIAFFTNKKSESMKFKLTIVAPYGYSNVIIRNSAKIIGTNLTVVNLPLAYIALTNNLSYELDGQKLTTHYSPARSKKAKVYITKPDVNEKAEFIIKKLALFDYKTDKINEIDGLSNDEEAIDLIFKSYNKSLYKCCEIMISNYWYSLDVKQQRERFIYYLQMPRYSYRLNKFVEIMAKVANPAWYKTTPVIPESNQKNSDKIYSEAEFEEILFSKENKLKITFNRAPMCSSPLIKKIKAELQVRTSIIERNFDIPEVLPYLREYQIKKELEVTPKSKKSNIYNRLRFENYFKILINNPSHIIQEDIQNTIKALRSDKYSIARELPMAMDKPEIWTEVGNTNGIQWGGRYGRYKRPIFHREIKSSNAFEACENLMKICFAIDLQIMAIDIFSRIPNDRAVNKVLEILPKHLYRVAKSDAINRAEIMKRFAEQSTNCNLTAEVICKYPFPGEEEVLKSIRNKCSEENKIKIDIFFAGE